MQQGVALLRELSAEGVGLLLRGPVAPGAVLMVQFPGPRRGTTHTQLARVVHAARQKDGWLVGCQLVPRLAEQDLVLLLPVLTGARG
jgi:hypothetical protein